jgi:alkanesulfonate monooxygenase SsuD/methylene tetrahydromethanopterin reductase-like flavin-dependent oxidoreductase (luciferase family)
MNSIGLEVQVLNASLRHPFLLAGQLAVAQAASGGRLRMGLGAGPHHLGRFDHKALGIGFPSPRARGKARRMLPDPACTLARRGR